MKCKHCGRDKEEAYKAVSYTCNPPFEVQSHEFVPEVHSMGARRFADIPDRTRHAETHDRAPPSKNGPSMEPIIVALSRSQDRDIDALHGYLARQTKKRADIVRDALKAIQVDLNALEEVQADVACSYLMQAPDAVLARLGRLLR